MVAVILLLLFFFCPAFSSFWTIWISLPWTSSLPVWHWYGSRGFFHLPPASFPFCASSVRPWSDVTWCAGSFHFSVVLAAPDVVVVLLYFFWRLFWILEGKLWFQQALCELRSVVLDLHLFLLLKWMCCFSFFLFLYIYMQSCSFCCCFVLWCCFVLSVLWTYSLSVCFFFSFIWFNILSVVSGVLMASFTDIIVNLLAVCTKSYKNWMLMKIKK